MPPREQGTWDRRRVSRRANRPDHRAAATRTGPASRDERRRGTSTLHPGHRGRHAASASPRTRTGDGRRGSVHPVGVQLRRSAGRRFACRTSSLRVRSSTTGRNVQRFRLGQCSLQELQSHLRHASQSYRRPSDRFHAYRLTVPDGVVGNPHHIAENGCVSRARTAPSFRRFHATSLGACCVASTPKMVIA
jgi:hypothetical protein